MNSQSVSTKQPDVLVLGELVEQISARLQNGEPIDIEQLTLEFPEHAERLRKVLPMLRELNCLDWTMFNSSEEDGPQSSDDQRKLGDFRILHQIGRGGMGVVFEAEQISIPRKVALKILPLAALVDHRALQRFKNEVAAIATLEHPHIVSVYAIGEERGIHFYAMQLIRGQSLAAVIRELRSRADRDERLSGDALQQAISDMEDVAPKSVPSPPPRGAEPANLVPSPPLRGRGQGEGDFSACGEGISPVGNDEPDETRSETVARGRSNTARHVGDQTYFRNIARLIQQAADALQHAHDHGIVHRDIKPSNLLLDAQAKLFVTDFGLARIETGAGVTMTGDVLGTLHYMSPEQVLANRVIVDHRTDVYSLGATLYELLTLQPMWSGEKKAEIIRQISFEEPTHPQRINPAIPTDLETIVLKSISKNPNERYDNAQAFADDLHSYLDLKPIRARRPTTIQRIAKWTRRNPAIMWSSVAILAVVIASLSLGIIGLATSNSLIRDEQANTKARADELKQVSDFQAEMLKQVDPTQAGKLLTDDLIAKFEKGLAKSDVPETEIVAQTTAFAALLKNVNATDAARELIDRAILRPAVAAIDKQFADQPVIAAHLHQVLASRYRDMGLYDAAQPLQELALATRRRILGEDHPETLYSINQIGELMLFNGKWNEAERYFREAVERYRRVLGNEDPGTLLSINNLGCILLEQGKFNDAEPFLQEALETRRHVLGDDHLDNLESIINQGHLLARQGKLSAAEQCNREALETSRRLLGDEHPTTLTALNNMGSVLSDQGKFGDAEPYFREGLETCRRVRGDEHRETVISIHNMGFILSKQSKESEAEQYYRDALEANHRVLGDQHPLSLCCACSLGTSLSKQGKFDDAVRLLEPSLAIDRRILGLEHTFTKGTMRSLVRAYAGLSQTDKLQPLREELIELETAAANKSDADRETLNNTAKSLLTDEIESMRDPARALGYAKRACALAAGNGGELVKFLDTLALAQFQTGDTESAIQTLKKAIAMIPSGYSGKKVDEIKERLATYIAAFANLNDQGKQLTEETASKQKK